MAEFSNKIATFTRHLALVLMALILTPALAGANERIEGSLRVDGQKRSYIAYLPDNLTSRNDWPVLIAYHPGLATADYMERTTEFHRLPDSEQFVVVYPDGFRRTWNAGECCGAAMRRNVDDLAFFEAMMDDLAQQTEGRIRPRAYVTGFSNGAIFAYHLACEMPERVAAIAPFASAYQFNNCDSGVVPVMHIHGTHDISAPVEGGSSGIKSFDQRIQAAADDTVARMAEHNSCSSRPARSEDSPFLKTACQVTDCNGVELKLCVVENLGHTWPGAAAADNFLGRKFGPARTDINGSQAILDFFEEYL